MLAHAERRLLEHRLFTVAEYYKMAEAGILTEKDRVELIEGEIVQMPPIGSAHTGNVARIAEFLLVLAGRTATIWVQNPIRLDEHTELQPDVALLRRREDYYTKAHPEPPDVLLVIEVSQTTVAYDRDVKIPLYARAGIPAAWIANLPEQRFEVYGDLAGGIYRTIRLMCRGESLDVPGLPGTACTVEDLLGDNA
jgi:Uma2 family endonuclease